MLGTAEKSSLLYRDDILTVKKFRKLILVVGYVGVHIEMEVSDFERCSAHGELEAVIGYASDVGGKCRVT